MIQGKCLTGTYAVALIVLLLIQLAGIVAPIIARDQAEELFFKSANRTMMVKHTSTCRYRLILDFSRNGKDQRNQLEKRGESSKPNSNVAESPMPPNGPELPDSPTMQR